MKKKDGYTRVQMYFLNWQGAITDFETVAEFYSLGWANYLLPELERREQESKKAATRVMPNERIEIQTWNVQEKKFDTYRSYNIYY